MELRRPKFCQLEALQRKLPRSISSSMCVYKPCYTYTHGVYIAVPRPWYKRKLRGSCPYHSVYVHCVSLLLRVCVVQDTMKRILILCFFTRAPAVSVFEFKRRNLFQRPASLYPLYRVLTLNQCVRKFLPRSRFLIFSRSRSWRAIVHCRWRIGFFFFFFFDQLKTFIYNCRNCFFLILSI